MTKKQKKKFTKKEVHKRQEPRQPVNLEMQTPPLLRYLKWGAFDVVLLCAFVLSLKMLREPDLWWQLRTGQYILENGVPDVDVFSYTMAGTEWINVKWGFEVWYALLAKIGGPEIIYIWQGLVAVGILLLLFRAYRGFRKYLLPDGELLPTVGWLIAAAVALVAMEYRIIGRPEMTSHLFTAGFLALLMLYRFCPGKFIWLVVPLQIIWANFHEGFGTGLVMLIAFTGAMWVSWFLRVKFFPEIKIPKPWHLTAAALVSIPAVAIHPFGVEMIMHPLNIFGQLSENQFTTELLSWQSFQYWKFQAYLNIGLFVLALVALFIKTKKENILQGFFAGPGLGYAGFLLMFFYLSLTAYRNIPFSVIVALPGAALTLDWAIRQIILRQKKFTSNFYSIRKFAFMLLPLLLVGFYIAIPTNYYYSLTNSPDRYGLGIDVLKNPTGAIDFVKEQGIEGRAFADYVTSSYPLYELQPDFKSYIDLRDLDVFPADFFSHFTNLVYRPENFSSEDSTYDFSYVLLYRPQFKPLHQYLMADTLYEMVFADPVAIIYAKRGAGMDEVIAQHGFNNGNRDIFSFPKQQEPSAVVTAINHIFWPLYKNEMRDANLHAEAASFYRSFGYRNLARQRAQQALHKGDAAGYAEMGNLLLEEAQNMQGDALRQKLTEAKNYYLRAYKLNKKMPSLLFGLGIVELSLSQPQAAELYFSECVSADPANIDCYQYLAEVQTRLTRQFPAQAKSYKEKRNKYLSKALKLNPDNPFLIYQLGISYCDFGDCENAMEQLNRVRNFAGLDQNQKQMVNECLKRCGN